LKQKSSKSLLDDTATLSDIGEFGLIDRVAEFFRKEHESDYLGIGDDCAVLPFRDGKSLLVTTDMLIENRHFRHDWITPEDLGYKSLAVNISDISAMGGKPGYAFLSLGLKSELSAEWLNRFFRGARELSRQNKISLMGGDTTKSPENLVISYTLLGTVDSNKVLLRSGAKPGDKIALLGKVGESGAGLKILMEGRQHKNEKFSPLVNAHNKPGLYVEEAQFLAEFSEIHSMIDLSDGIQSDAGHIAKRSGVELNIDIEKLPVSKSLIEYCDLYSCSATELALTAGEDYGLLFTISGEAAEKTRDLFRDQFGYSFTLIGNVKDGEPSVNYFKEGKPVEIDKHGFDHFKTQ
jgi:thiamine-monophosphate kinase